MSSPPFVSLGTSRITRLMLKELREILRDRRTIITLVLMPLILYPLLSVAFQQFFLTSMGKQEAVPYQLGFQNFREARLILGYLIREGNLPVTPETSASENGSETTAPAVAPPGNTTTNSLTPDVAGKSAPQLKIQVIDDLETAVRNQTIDVGFRVKPGKRPRPARPERDLDYDVELVFNRDSLLSRGALELVRSHLQSANLSFLGKRLQVLNVSQRAEPVRAVDVPLADVQGPSSPVSSLMAIIPMILIMMTVTGAVYPAIDLTAGERERGTLEILVAAPVPRIGLLFGKYVAVVCVALLTAAANLLMMTATVLVSGLAPALFGPGGLPLHIVLQVFGLLILFAAFFSAVLLVLTSFARSFKEAQAYLIPLMLVSLAPGALCLKTDLHLEGWLLVTPLVNIVLLGRDLFSGNADTVAVVMVVLSTLLYALAAITLAARIFGAESVLYSSPSAWGDLFTRPLRTRGASTVTGAMLLVATLFPVFFFVNSSLSRLAAAWQTASVPWSEAATAFDWRALSSGEQRAFIEKQLILAGSGTMLVFGLLPWMLARWRQIRVAAAFSLRWPAPAALLGAGLLGVSLWMGAHELIVLQSRVGIVSIDIARFKEVQQLVAILKSVPLWLILLSFAAAPALCEEWLFRGFLFSALRQQYSVRKAILISAVLFGVFHVVGRSGFTIERWLTSTLLGAVLGWLCWRTSSLIPGIVLHLCNNGLLFSIAYFQDELRQRGWDVTTSESELRTGGDNLAHLPPAWLAAGAVLALLGFAAIHWGCPPSRSIAESASSPHE